MGSIQPEQKPNWGIAFWSKVKKLKKVIQKSQFHGF